MDIAEVKKRLWLTQAQETIMEEAGSGSVEEEEDDFDACEIFKERCDLWLQVYGPILMLQDIATLKKDVIYLTNQIQQLKELSLLK